MPSQFRTPTVVIFLVAFFVGNFVSAQQPRKVALLIGVEKYDHRGFSDLNFAEDDMLSLYTKLKTEGFEVAILQGSNSGSRQANRDNILRIFTKHFLPRLKGLKKNDISLLALAGHGRHKQVSQDGEKKEDHFFCPSDAKHTDSKTWISLNSIIAAIEKTSGSERNLILVDACRDNPARGRGVDGSGFTLNREAVAVLFASSYNEQAFEPAELRHGLFTYYVIKALSGDAKNFDDEVTWDSLVDYVKGRVEKHSRKLHADSKIGGLQRPNSIGNLRGKSPVLVRLESPPPVPKANQREKTLRAMVDAEISAAIGMSPQEAVSELQKLQNTVRRDGQVSPSFRSQQLRRLGTAISNLKKMEMSAKQAVVKPSRNKFGRAIEDELGISVRNRDNSSDIFVTNIHDKTNGFELGDRIVTTNVERGVRIRHEVDFAKTVKSGKLKSVTVMRNGLQKTLIVTLLKD